MIRDNVKTKFKAGHGGNGVIRFPKFEKRATGGDGGKGGDIYLEGSGNIFDLGFVKPSKTFAAQNGGHGGENKQRGKAGDDLIFKVPLVTTVYDSEEREILVVKKHGDRHLLLRGGRGGHGNYFFRTKGEEGKWHATEGLPGQEAEVRIELSLYSDVIFIGLPNAGKSSVLNEVANAHSKVASYAFTTLDPHLGRAYGMTLMDLPGLIEGTFEGRGLGTGFVKHTRFAKVVAHFVSMESDDPIRDYEMMRKELQNINKELADKPEVIVLTKHDLLSRDQIEAKKKLFEKYNRPITIVSIHDIDALEAMLSVFKQVLDAVIQKEKVEAAAKLAEGAKEVESSEPTKELANSDPIA